MAIPELPKSPPEEELNVVLLLVLSLNNPPALPNAPPVVLVFELDAPKRFEVVDAALFPNKLVVAAAGFAVDPNKLVVPLVFV